MTGDTRPARPRRMLAAAAALFVAATLLVAIDQAPAAAAPEDCQPPGWYLSDIAAGPIGTSQHVVLHVDFPDAVGVEPTSDDEVYFDDLRPFYDESSYGLLDITVDHVTGWIRMPDDAASYGVTRENLTAENHRVYLQAAVDAADPSVDFTGYDVVHVVPSPASRDSITTSAVYVADVLTSDEVTFSSAAHYDREGFDTFGPELVTHETGHVYGLPDLYSFGTPDPDDFIHVFVGGWDVMGYARGHAPGLFGWQRLALGWLGDQDIHCVVDEGTVDLDIAPVGAATGERLILVPRSDGSLVGVEYRDGDGVDQSICRTGVLVHEIDPNRARGDGPIIVADPTPDDPAACLYDKDDAALAATEQLTLDGITIEVLDLRADGAEVRVTRDGPFMEPLPAVEPVLRLAGASRVATAIEASRVDFPDADSARAVVLTRADGFADALSGTPLAVATGAPILLTPTAALPREVTAEIDRVLPTNGTVFVLGGEVAVAPGVVTALRARGYAVRRLGGDNRFDTATVVANELGNPSDVLLASGLRFPDAVTAGAAAAQSGAVVLLTADDQPAPETTAYLATHGTGRTWAVGGVASRAHPAATPLVGENRYATAVLVAEEFFRDPFYVGLARGDDFPDALAGGAYVGARGGPMLLTPSTELHEATADFLCGAGATAEQAVLFGGTVALSNDVARAAEAAVTGTSC